MKERGLHNYVYAAGGFILALLIGVQSGTIPLPPEWRQVLTYLPTAIAILNMLLPAAGRQDDPPRPHG